MSHFPDAELLLFTSCLLLAYAEIHYKFKWIPSRYFIKEPEIISDVPTRIEPDITLSTLLTTIQWIHFYHQNIFFKTILKNRIL